KVVARFETSPWDTARWIAADNSADLKAFIETHKSATATDRDGAPVFMAKDLWELNFHEQRNPNIRFTATKERT
ncbi:MAG TPA: peptide chain release factor 3, partial [Allosphingosinicella sp.]